MIAYSTKKPHKWKKHSVSIFVLTTVFEKMCPHLIWDFLSYLSRQKGTSGNISQPRPVHFSASASKMRPRLRKTFPRFPFVYFGNLGKTQIRGQKFFLRRVIEKKQNKIPFLLSVLVGSIFLEFKNSSWLQTLDGSLIKIATCEGELHPQHLHVARRFLKTVFQQVKTV